MGWKAVLCVGAMCGVCAAADAPKPSLKSVAWLTGQWRDTAANRLQEETWSAPAGGAMVGTFRLVVNDKPALYEFLLLEETADGVTMRLQHFRPGMVAKEPKPIRLTLVAADATRAAFENPDGDAPKGIEYRRPSPDALAVTVRTTRDGKPATLELAFERVPAEPAK